MAINRPDVSGCGNLAQGNAAPQRTERQHDGHADSASIKGDAAQHERDRRPRGPHPLPLFLSIAARHCGDDRARLAAVLQGLARYQAMPPPAPRAPAPVVAQAGAVMLRDHGHDAQARPVLVVPSLINPPTVLDLAPGRSLLADLASRGLRPLMVDWGEAPEPLGLGDLVEARLRPLLDGLGRPVPVIGYCLGGTLAAGLAALAGPQVERLALLATPWHFSGYGDAARRQLSDWWAQAKPLAAMLGGLPMDLLQPAFWGLDEAALVAKYARLAKADAHVLDGFAALEDWSNAGPPLSLPAARDMAGFFADDAPGLGQWRIGGEAVDAGQIRVPVLDVVAMRDRIVPPTAALSAGQQGQMPALRRLDIDAGHVGMIVGRRAESTLWAPLADWLCGHDRPE